MMLYHILCHTLFLSLQNSKQANLDNHADDLNC